MKSDTKPNVDMYQELTDRVIARMEHALEWEKGWMETSSTSPFNPITGTRYSGINFVSLAVMGQIDPRWYTYNNIKQLSDAEPEKGIHLKKGSLGVPVYKLVDVSVTDKGEVDPETGKLEVKNFRVLKRAGFVFNASCVEGLEPYQERTITSFERDERVSILMAAMESTGLKFEHSGVGSAYYQPASDKIHMPNPEYFKSDNAYYETLFHEIAHSTGAKSRLDRPMKGAREDIKAYAFEELIAELSAVYTSAQFGMQQTGQIDNHAAYLKSWIQALKNDKTFIFKASTEATKATTYQMERYQEIEISRAQEQPKVEAAKVNIIQPVAQVVPKLEETPKIASGGRGGR